MKPVRASVFIVLSKLKDKKVDVVTSPHLSIPITVELFFNTLRLKTEQKV